jgi:hypothetical protein
MRLGTKDPLAPRRGEQEEEEKKGEEAPRLQEF